MTIFQRILVGLGVAAMAATPMLAQELQQEGPVPTTALISVQVKKNAPNPQLDPADVKLQLNRHDAPITSIVPVRPSNAEIAILIDDGLRSSVSLQLKDIATFINQLPPGAKVLVGYMQNGTVRSAGQFTADHEQAASELRVPFSSVGASASPYFCLSDFVKHWPSGVPAARMVLMITNGVDPYNGRPSILNQDSPYVQTAQEDAERAGVAVYSIYYGDSGMRGGRGSFSGQGYLSQLAEATGGISFYQGSIPPVSFGPYLDQFATAIRESYIVTFLASSNREKRDTLTGLKITTSQPGLKIVAPEGVHPGTMALPGVGLAQQ